MEIFDDKKRCCGCTACMNICPKNAIEMIEDEEGFKYPRINKEKCIECGLCKKICAFQNGTEVDERIENAEVYAAKNKDDAVRMKSSSGGMFATISDYVLNNNGVIYGVAFDENFKAKHIRAENKSDRDKCLGSKYSQSELGDIFKLVKKDLENEKTVLFTGTPCQVAGLNKFLNKTDKQNLILVDIVCHGAPSPKLFKEYIECISKTRKKKIKNYYHRSKKNGWGHNEEIVFEGDKSEIGTRLADTWKRIFYTNLPLRPSCYNCVYTSNKRMSDITIADFWGIQDFENKIYDKKGISLVIVNTQKGKSLFNNINNDLYYENRKMEEATKKNPQLYKPVKISEDERMNFWKIYYNKGIRTIMSKYGGYNFIGRTKHLVKKILRKK